MEAATRAAAAIGGRRMAAPVVSAAIKTAWVLLGGSVTSTSPSPNGKRAGKPFPRGEGLSSAQHSAQQSPRTTEQHRERISPFSDLSSGLSPGSASSAGATAPSRQPISPLQGQNHPPTVLRLSDVLPLAPCETRLAQRPKAPPGQEDGVRAATACCSHRYPPASRNNPTRTSAPRRSSPTATPTLPCLRR